MMIQHKIEKKERAASYNDNYDHLEDELKRLDLLIQKRVIAVRFKYQTMQKAIGNQQRYISHEEVDWLLRNNGTFAVEPPELQNIHRQLGILQNEINTRVKKSMEERVFLSLPHLAHLFALSPFELQTVLICLAPELDRKYDKLYAYLQDDITRKKPSIDLVLDLLCDTQNDRWKARTIFSDNSPLFSSEIVHVSHDSESPSGSSGLAKFIKLDQRIINHILGNNGIDGRLLNLVRLFNPSPSMDHVPVAQSIKTKALNLTLHHLKEQRISGKNLALYFHGKYGVGKRTLALGICGKVNCPMLYLDMEEFLPLGQDFEPFLRLAFREGLLLQSALYIANADVLQEEDRKTKAFLKKLAKMIEEYGWLIFLAGERPWLGKEIFENALFHAIELPIPDVPLREEAWKKTLKNISVEPVWAEQLAGQFSLTPGQIRDAAEFVVIQREMNSGQCIITLADLYTACRNQSNQKLNELSLKIEPSYGWEDIILPKDKLEQLREICSQVIHRYHVFGQWGFDNKLSHGKGLSVLFSGPPGTGKTMAAEVIAHELKLDLYKIDLSGVVSKYIGETEKNLSKIFQEAETSNAILFFDEADALFGKRTEVSDAHDRYANFETSYLLQKMEEYEGVVILASNLRENMDEGFTRRIRFIVEFPFPDEASRLLIWKTHFPKETPISEDIDYEFLSKQFQIAGGNIKNIVLNSAFLAAENGRIINMEHILRGTQREFEKIGKLWNEKNLISPNG
jgi:ATP-dependent 26S proteasome regulatory subunit